MVNDLDYKGIELPVSKKDYKKIERNDNIYTNVFFCENSLTYPIHISKQKFEYYMDLLLINYVNKSHYVYIKDFNKYIFSKKSN